VTRRAMTLNTQTKIITGKMHGRINDKFAVVYLSSSCACVW